ncbi:uncharacterized protein LOC133777900 isoform X2 [Humulus lupulus]|uniref:uncharacterized protein LOC133777900 isoform X2 n=1 Tax=Humulus lupulus TaxID=3486 RepID=UPI002B404E0D|nr:uncharacterized protein LOC133777900 isoform X2 [Humulus lupulus]
MMTLLCYASFARTNSSLELRPSNFPVSISTIPRRHDLLFFAGNGGSSGVQGSFSPNQIAEVGIETEMGAVSSCLVAGRACINGEDGGLSLSPGVIEEGDVAISENLRLQRHGVIVFGSFYHPHVPLSLSTGGNHI